MLSGISNTHEFMPASSHALFLFRTYTCDAGLSPTIITARPGVIPVLAIKCSVSFLMRARVSAAILFPSIILAIVLFL